jgi:hypothetical protein
MLGQLHGYLGWIGMNGAWYLTSVDIILFFANLYHCYELSSQMSGASFRHLKSTVLIRASLHFNGL